MPATLLFEIVVSGCGVSSPRKTMSELALKYPIGGSGTGLSERHKVLTMCKRGGLAYPHVLAFERIGRKPDQNQGRGCCNRPDLREPRRAAGRLEAHLFRAL